VLVAAHLANNTVRKVRVDAALLLKIMMESITMIKAMTMQLLVWFGRCSFSFDGGHLRRIPWLIVVQDVNKRDSVNDTPLCYAG
jgi:hypothetical protein